MPPKKRGSITAGTYQSKFFNITIPVNVETAQAFDMDLSKLEDVDQWAEHVLEIDNGGMTLFDQFVCKKERTKVNPGELDEHWNYHWQIGVKLKARRTLNGCKKMTEGLLYYAVKRGDISYITENTGDWSYIKKYATTVPGHMNRYIDSKNWRPVQKPHRTMSTRYYQKKRERGKLFSWQQECEAEIKALAVMDVDEKMESPTFMRKIQVIVDRKGGVGKSVFKSCIEHEVDQVVGFFGMNDAGEAIKAMCSKFTQMGIAKDPRRAPSVILIDLPSAVTANINLKTSAQFLQFCETVKNGNVYDTRYCWTELKFDNPALYLFANDLPDVWFKKRLLSPDRLRVRYIRETVEGAGAGAGGMYEADYGLFDDEPEEAEGVNGAGGGGDRVEHQNA